MPMGIKEDEYSFRKSSNNNPIIAVGILPTIMNKPSFDIH